MPIGRFCSRHQLTQPRLPRPRCPTSPNSMECRAPRDQTCRDPGVPPENCPGERSAGKDRARLCRRPTGRRNPRPSSPAGQFSETGVTDENRAVMNGYLYPLRTPARNLRLSRLRPHRRSSPGIARLPPVCRTSRRARSGLLVGRSAYSPDVPKNGKFGLAVSRQSTRGRQVSPASADQLP